MKNLFLLSLMLVLFSSCSNFKMEELYGSWTSETINITFNKDNTIEYNFGQIADKGTYRALGNAIEVINSENKVFTRITIKSLVNDELTIDLPIMGASSVRKLSRKK